MATLQNWIPSFPWTAPGGGGGAGGDQILPSGNLGMQVYFRESRCRLPMRSGSPISPFSVSHFHLANMKGRPCFGGERLERCRRRQGCDFSTFLMGTPNVCPTATHDVSKACSVSVVRVLSWGYSARKRRRQCLAFFLSFAFTARA